MSPVYRAAAVVEELVRQVTAQLSTLTEDFEIILVEDGSPDDSWEKICAACERDTRVKAIRLSRNFGQHIAISAGLAQARGEFVIVMDCDLQDDPAYIPVLLAEAKRGGKNDAPQIIFTRKVRSGHTASKNFFAQMYHRAFAWLSDGITTDEAIGAYSLLTRKVVDAYLLFQDRHRHYLLLLRWLGFPSAVVPIEHRRRYAGTSSYSFVKLVQHAIDGIISHSTRLLYATVLFGLAFCAASFIAAGIIVWLYFVHGFREGWASIATLILGSTGVVLCSLGVLGLYIGKMFEQVKGRPLYVLAETRNVNESAFRNAFFNSRLVGNAADTPSGND